MVPQFVKLPKSYALLITHLPNTGRDFYSFRNLSRIPLKQIFFCCEEIINYERRKDVAFTTPS